MSLGTTSRLSGNQLEDESDEVMREADANNTSGELGSSFPGSLVGESVFRTAKLEILTESASLLSLVSVVPECQSEW